MYKVLIPFTEPDGGERAVRHLLKEPPRALQVELLAIIEATGLHTSRRYISAASAEEAARATAMVWIAKVAPILQAAGVPYKTHVVVGRPLLELDAAVHRLDVDWVLMPDSVPHWPAASPPATVVA